MITKQQILLTIIIYFCSGEIKSNNSDLRNYIKTKTPFDIQVKIPFRNGNNCTYDNEVKSLGTGLVITASKFDIFNDSLLTEKLASFDMFSEVDNKVAICSKFYKPDYGVMHFICIGETAKSYIILINYSDIKYLPKTNKYQYKTWTEYILQSFGIRRIRKEKKNNSESTHLRKEPKDNSETVTIPKGHEMFCPMEISGDWVKVKYDCFYNEPNNPHEGQPCHNFIDECKDPLTGWLKWKQGNKLLIDIFLMP